MTVAAAPAPAANAPAAPAAPEANAAPAPAANAPAATPAAPVTGNAPAPAAPATPAPATPPAAPAEVNYSSVKAPEGFDAAALPKMLEVAKQYGLSPEAAQKLINDSHTNAVAAKTAETAALAKQEADNLTAIKADKEYGGEKFQASIQRAQQVVEKLEAGKVPGLKAAIDQVPANHPLYPTIVRLFNVLGDGMREDSFAVGSPPAADAPSLADSLYAATMKPAQGQPV